MRSNLTGSLLGGPILTQLASYINSAVGTLQQAAAGGSSSAPAASSFYQLVFNSGHYNTLLGTMMAMSIDTYAPAVQVIRSQWRFHYLLKQVRNPRIVSSLLTL